MNISINPSYYCNFRCSFCYLGKKLSDRKKIEISDLKEKLDQLSKEYEISQIDLYGGEISELPFQYQKDLIELLSRYTKQKIMITTNFSNPEKLYRDSSTDICISYDYKARQDWDKVMNNIIMEGGGKDILVLASKNLIKQSPLDLILNLNMLSPKSVEIKPYSTNQFNSQDVSFRDYENLIIELLRLEHYMLFEFKNKSLIEHSLLNKRNAFSNDHIYITPNNKFAVLDFDQNDNEFFLELNSLKEYQEWTKKEVANVYKNSYCNNCEYQGRCLTEHYRDVLDISKSCNGFKGLLDWYKENRWKNGNTEEKHTTH